MGEKCERKRAGGKMEDQLGFFVKLISYTLHPLSVIMAGKLLM